MDAQCLISFGSNLGDRDTVIAEAARHVAASSLVTGFTASRLFETPPIGGPGGQEPFLNAVAAFDTVAPAREILTLLQQTEAELGRERRHRWGARSIDLDVVLHGELVGGGTGLIVPHPRYTARQFVLQPACDVAPHYRDPRFGSTLQRLAEHVSAGVASLALIGGDAATRELICERLHTGHGVRTFRGGSPSEPIGVLGNAPVTVNQPGGDGSDEESSAKQRVASGEQPAPIMPRGDAPWVSAFVPPLPPLESKRAGAADVPRLVARLQWSTPETRWPAPHQMWPGSGRWPEYRLEIDDLDWAVREVASALDSMRCPCRPVTTDGDWWRSGQRR